MADTEGIVCGYILDRAGHGREIDWTAAAAWAPEQGALWLHLDRGTERTRSWIEDGAGLDPLVAEALLAEETRPRCMAFNDGLLLILRGVNLNPGADPEDMVSVRLWVERDRVISVRLRRLMAVEDVRDAIAAGKGPKSTGELIVELADHMLDRMQPVIGDLEDRIDALEDEIVESESREVRGSLRAMRRQAIALRRYLAPQRDALARLQIEERDWIGQRQRVRFREIADSLTRYVEALDEVRDRAAVIQDELVNILSEHMNRTVYLLTVVATIMLPLGFLTGLLGINVGGIPGSENPLAFWMVCGGLAFLVTLEVWIFRRLKWL
ncbi:MAG: zinc transporter ZntB [Rhodospirillales bacterium]|nr:zinc transporter ZntB [Rhodospirillales bacterium]MCW8862871.1 zinc transporter ZntB [Rhodospirillales bacterium]MCW8952049.1 zinc transporter ZntB [Rhodospirillales bacterium]MCW9001388.1 zinc transporter ZntB [Rhodospirillales bacterium]